MNDRAAFLRAICETPFDDAPRLVFADWLDETMNGHDAAIAEHIRVAIQHPARISGYVALTGFPTIDCMRTRGFPYHVEITCRNAANLPPLTFEELKR